MSKELEALHKLATVSCVVNRFKGTDEPLKVLYKEDYDIIEKSLKALEIIKKHIKIVNGQFIFKGISYKKNIKDYELLKEALL